MSKSDHLGEQAQIAYRAYLDMSDSGQAHLSQLESLKNKYQAGGAPSAGESAELGALLAAHDRNVIAFKTAMAAVTDEADMQALLELMS